MKKQKTKTASMAFLIILATLAIFFGTANPLYHIPLVILLYPAALYMIAQKAVSQKQAFLCGFLAGIPGMSALVYWLVIPLEEYAFFPLTLAIPVPICAGIYIALYGAIFSAAMYKAQKLSSYLQPIFAFVLWYMLEWVRSWLFTGITWGNIAAGNAAFPVLVQGVSILGMTGLSALYAALGVSLFHKKKSIQLFAIFSIFALVGFGFYRISKPIEAANHANFLLVQGNLAQDEKWEKAMQERTVKKYLQLSQWGVEEGRRGKAPVSFVIFPETSLPFFLQAERNYQKTFSNFATTNNLTMLIGAVSYKQIEGKNLIYNSLFSLKAKEMPEISDEKTINLLSAHYHFTADDIYSKQHLVPFGEYVPPFLDFEVFKPLLQGIGGFTPAYDQNPLRQMYNGEEISLGALICYEAIFSDLAQDQVEKGAQILINISNDAWYGQSSAAKQHLDLSLLRAIEQGRYLLRATNTGITAGINPYGQIIKSTHMFRDTYLEINAGFIDAKTIFHRIYPFLTPIISLLFFLFVCMLFRQKRQNKF